MQARKRKIRTFLKGILLAVIALSLIEIGRQYSLQQAVNSSEAEVSSSDAEHSTVASRSAEEHFFLSSFKDFQEELSLANQEGKTGVFVFFEMQNCPYCEYMKSKILNQQDVQEFYTQNFRTILIDIHTQTEATDFDGTEMTEAGFAKKYAAELTPTMIFYGVNGDEVYRQVGFQKTKEQFMDMGKMIVELSDE